MRTPCEEEEDDDDDDAAAERRTALHFLNVDDVDDDSTMMR